MELIEHYIKVSATSLGFTENFSAHVRQDGDNAFAVPLSIQLGRSAGSLEVNITAGDKIFIPKDALMNDHMYSFSDVIKAITHEFVHQLDISYANSILDGQGGAPNDKSRKVAIGLIASGIGNPNKNINIYKKRINEVSSYQSEGIFQNHLDMLKSR